MTPLPPEPTILDQIAEVARSITITPRPARLAVAPDAVDQVIRALTGLPHGEAHAMSPLDQLLGIPVVPDPNLPPGEWELFDTDGNELAAGNVAPIGHAPTGLADAFGGYECVCGEPYSDLHTAATRQATPK